ncbi:uncharacterized protein LOC120108817 [Phoenix dactylifera]|uniref:Uncharacterized protein LOC120108817 n=1 Tax=Phoenix dactylifera TaxID=42345 RepID=A0A8B9A3Q3_PHODC|nr:uncharacterized protein LOC120108817 [Phoenix dactylifera]
MDMQPPDPSPLYQPPRATLNSPIHPLLGGDRQSQNSFGQCLLESAANEVHIPSSLTRDDKITRTSPTAAETRKWRLAIEKRDLSLSLPLSASWSNASSAGGSSYSPRSPLSRWLLPLRKPSPGVRRGGGGGGGGGKAGSGLGRLVRLPRFCCKKKKKKKKEEEEVGPSVSEVVEGDGAGCRGSSRTLSVSSDGEKPEEISLNLGMGLGPVFLLTRCATEFKRMTEMQAQMESLLKEITNEVLRNDVIHSTLESSNHATFSGPDCSGDVHSSKASPSQSHIASFQQEGARCAIEPDVQSNYATISENKSCLKMDQLEAEIEVEPEHLQPNLERENSSVL